MVTIWRYNTTLDTERETRITIRFPSDLVESSHSHIHVARSQRHSQFSYTWKSQIWEEKVTRMHIGINAQFLSYGQNFRNGGVSRYIRYLLTALAKQAGDNRYTVFVNGQDIIDRLAPHPQITYLAAPWPEKQPAARVVWEQITLPSLLRPTRLDLFHSPITRPPDPH